MTEIRSTNGAKPIPVRGVSWLLVASGMLLLSAQAFSQDANRSVCTQGTGRVAVTACEEALRQDPGNAEIARALAAHHNGAGQYDEALAVLSAASQRNPAHHGLLYDIGATICFKSSGAEAIIVCKAAVRADPSDVAVSRTLARHHREAKQFGDALDVLNAALVHNPNNKYLLSDLSSVNSDVAEDEWLRSQKEKDGDGTATTEKSVDRLARIRCRKLSGNAAVEACDAALLAEPDDGVLLVHRATHLESLGETDRAIADYRAALASDPDNAEARNRLAVLER
jgi:tetratricopeptide (TPR) repeat protein